MCAVVLATVNVMCAVVLATVNGMCAVVPTISCFFFCLWGRQNPA
jgi:hypothetical protein